VDLALDGGLVGAGSDAGVGLRGDTVPAEEDRRSTFSGLLSPRDLDLDGVPVGAGNDADVGLRGDKVPVEVRESGRPVNAALVSGAVEVRAVLWSPVGLALDGGPVGAGSDGEIGLRGDTVPAEEDSRSGRPVTMALGSGAGELGAVGVW